MMKMLRTRKGFTLVELMIVVAIIGILAALAIPAFLRAVKKSKTAEAEGIMRKMADGSKSYFTSEQKFTDAAGGGDQPWHIGSATPSDPNAFGLPVKWSSYVFPGGTAMAGFQSTEGIAGAYNASNGNTDCGAANAPTGGSKAQPAAIMNANTDINLTATLNKLNVAFTDPAYFQYGYGQQGVGSTALASIGACANFDIAGANNHTITQLVAVDPNNQEVLIRPATTRFEFE